MAYLGNTPTTQNFVSGTDYFNGTGSQTAFTLSRTVGSINDIQVTVNNVVQQPNDAYTLSGTTLTMTSAPSSGTNNVYVRYLSTTTQVITPSQNTVGTAQLGTITNIASGNSSLTLQTGSSPTTAVTIGTDQRAAFVAGTAALPAITTTGDTNTGIFFSAADTIDFAEGGTATGQFDSSGNFKFNSGFGSVGTAYGCRAWVNFDGYTNTGGFCTIRGSGNVTTVADNGTGDYTVNFITALPDVNYCVQYSLGALDSNFWGPIPYIYSQATTSCRVRSVFASGSFNDAGTSNVSIFR
jgi:hypothetical protein